MAESVAPQPSPREIIGALLYDDHIDWCSSSCGFNQGDEADRLLDALTAAGFRIVPPGWDIVKLETVATSSMTGNFGGQTIVPVVETVAWRVTERFDG